MPAQPTLRAFADFAPVAGYNGVIFVLRDALRIPVYASNWSLNFTTDTLSTDRTNRFGRTESLYFVKDSTPGLTGVTASVTGWYDDSFLGVPFSTSLFGLNIRPGNNIVAFFGHTSKSGYTLKGYVSTINPSVSVVGTNNYSWTLQVTEIVQIEGPFQAIQQPNMNPTVPNIPVPRLN